jgi:prepilin-type N-terminal cleavage/methylation domain-containing protein
MFRPLRIYRRLSPSPCRGAFTLIELMVVVAIIVILTAITLPAVKALTQGNSQKQAVNLVSALLANARAVAITSHKPAGIVIYEDPGTKSQSSVQVVICSSIVQASNTATTFSFVRAPSQGPQTLPYGVRAGTLSNSSTSVFNTGDASTQHPRVVLFDENGQLLLQNNLLTDASLASDASASAWNLQTSKTPNSSPAVIIYDENALQAAVQSGQLANTTSTTLVPWFEQNADILVVNPYTGNIIR